MLIGPLFYPSDNATRESDTTTTPTSAAVSKGPGVLVASYTWGLDARRLGNMPTSQREELAIRLAARVHPELDHPGVIRRNEVRSWFWDQHRWSGGAFAFYMPGQFATLHRHVVAPEGRDPFRRRALLAQSQLDAGRLRVGSRCGRCPSRSARLPRARPCADRSAWHPSPCVSGSCSVGPRLAQQRARPDPAPAFASLRRHPHGPLTTRGRRQAGDLCREVFPLSGGASQPSPNHARRSGGPVPQHLVRTCGRGVCLPSKQPRHHRPRLSTPLSAAVRSGSASGSIVVSGVDPMRSRRRFSMVSTMTTTQQKA